MKRNLFADYSGYMANPLNRMLRGNADQDGIANLATAIRGRPLGAYEPDEADAIVSDYVQKFDDAIGRAPPLPYQLTVYRGLSDVDMTEFTSGAFITDAGYVSTSMNETVAKGFGGVVAVITLPAGTRGIDMRELSSVGPEEAELLLPRDSTFEVTVVRESRVQMRLVSQERSH